VLQIHLIQPLRARRTQPPHSLTMEVLYQLS
jgi:hypothetical protein